MENDIIITGRKIYIDIIRIIATISVVFCMFQHRI